jgi:hypothetical protein
VTLDGAGLDNQGSINLSGGTLSGSGAKTNNGALSGYGTISGSGALNNYGAVNLSGGASAISTGVTNQAAGQLSIGSGGATNFTGPVTNYGTVRATNAMVTWGGPFTNAGAYISDPSNNYFSNLTVTSDGYLAGGVRDLFSLSGNFESRSTQNINWNTVGADLAFTGGGTHQLDITGADLGKINAGYTNNFAWGSQDLTGQSLTLMDGNDTLGGGFYVGRVTGLTFNGNTVTDITSISGLDLYYDIALNPDLHGLTYTLTGGGLLEPAGNPVPLPPTLVLFGSGLLGLVGWRRFRKG